MGGLIAVAAIVGYFVGAGLCAFLTTRIADERDAATATIQSVIWPVLLPFLLVFWAAKRGAR